MYDVQQSNSIPVPLFSSLSSDLFQLATHLSYNPNGSLLAAAVANLGLFAARTARGIPVMFSDLARTCRAFQLGLVKAKATHGQPTGGTSTISPSTQFRSEEI